MLIDYVELKLKNQAGGIGARGREAPLRDHVTNLRL